MFRTALLILVLSAVAWLAVDKAVEYGAFSHFHKHHPGKCRKINNAQQWGSEDFQITSAGLAFISSGLDLNVGTQSYKEFLKRNNVKGKMLLVDLTKPVNDAKELTLKSTADFNAETFRPHGISLLEDSTTSQGQHLVYVINHPPGEPDRVEKFRYIRSSQELQHLRTFFCDQFRTLNDLAVVKEDVFYVTVSMYATTPFWRIPEILLPVSLGSVLLIDGAQCSTAVPSLRGPNGILVSRDGGQVYLNLPHTGTMAVFSRDRKDHSLTLTQTVELHTYVDNSHFTQSGDAIVTGCHPIFLKALAHFSSPDRIHGPSQVLHIPLSDGRVLDSNITELFYDHGDLISGSSTAALYNDLLLVSSVAHNLVLCDTKGLHIK